MSIGSISGNSIWTQMQQFKSGKVNLQKADLEQMQQQATQAGSQTQATNPFDSLLAAFDEIDTNQDGISVDELKSYAKENGMAEGGPGRGSRPEGPPPGPPLSMVIELGGSSQEGGPGGMPESVSKEELLDIQSQMEAEGIEVPEQLSQMIENFDALDTDGDGKISVEEMMAAQKTEESEATANAGANESQKLDFLKLIEKYGNELSEETSSKSSSDASQDMAIKFMRAINQYSSFASYQGKDMSSSLFETDA